MKTLKNYSGLYLLTDNDQKLVILTREGGKKAGHCYYMSNDFSKVNAHQRLGFNCLDSDIEWKWALSKWGKKPQEMSKEEVDFALQAIKELRHLISDQTIEIDEPVATGATQKLSSNQSLIALRAMFASK